MLLSCCFTDPERKQRRREEARRPPLQQGGREVQVSIVMQCRPTVMVRSADSVHVHIVLITGPTVKQIHFNSIEFILAASLVPSWYLLSGGISCGLVKHFVYFGRNTAASGECGAWLIRLTSDTGHCCRRAGAGRGRRVSTPCTAPPCVVTRSVNT